MKRKPQGFWNSVINRRQLFCDYAEQMGFNPLVAENWYNVSHAMLAEKMVNIASTLPHGIDCLMQGSLCLSQYNGSLRRALRHAFPELTFAFPRMTPKPRVIIDHLSQRIGRKVTGRM